MKLNIIFVMACISYRFAKALALRLFLNNVPFPSGAPHDIASE